MWQNVSLDLLYGWAHKYSIYIESRYKKEEYTKSAALSVHISICQLVFKCSLVLTPTTLPQQHSQCNPRRISAIQLYTYIV